MLHVLGASLCSTAGPGEQSHWPHGDHFPACGSQTVSGVLYGWDGGVVMVCCLVGEGDVLGMLPGFLLLWPMKLD